MEKIVKLKIKRTNGLPGTIFKEIHIDTSKPHRYADLYDRAKFIWLTNYLNGAGVFDDFEMIRDGERLAGVEITGISITDLHPIDFGCAFDE